MTIQRAVKKRDAEATRERILECAKQLFSEKGYDPTSTREIAACAGVNSALVARYFGSKKELFKEAVLPEFDISDMVTLDTQDLAHNVAELFARKPPKDHFDPIAALMRSAGSQEVGDLVQATISDQIIGPISQMLEGEDTEQRAAILFSLLSGFDIFRRTIGVSALNGEAEDKAQRVLELCISHLLSEP